MQVRAAGAAAQEALRMAERLSQAGGGPDAANTVAQVLLCIDGLLPLDGRLFYL